MHYFFYNDKLILSQVNDLHLIINFTIMSNINIRYVTDEEMIQRETRINNHYAKKRVRYLKLSFSVVCSLLIIVWLFNVPKEVISVAEAEKTGALCQNLAFTDSERFEKECDVEKVVEIIKEVTEIQEERVEAPIKDIEERAFNAIAQFEWYSDKPYFDNKQWSCWYGMACSKDTVWITKEKSKWFVIQRIKHIREKHKLYRFDDNIEVALISFIYNIWHPPVWYVWYIDNNYNNALKNMMKKYVYAGDKKLWGLVKRRNYETSLF